MTADRAWQRQVESVVRSMVRPLVTDGGRFEVVSCDDVTRQVVVAADMGACEACAMSDADLARLLEEAIGRSSPGVTVTVQSRSA